MTKKCQLTGKKPTIGRTYALRGIAKKKKGIGLKITGKNKRAFLPNLVKKRLWFAEEKRFITLKLSASGLRTIDKIGLFEAVKRMRAKGIKI
jgi:large subunit ribosomal protein L28